VSCGCVRVCVCACVSERVHGCACITVILSSPLRRMTLLFWLLVRERLCRACVRACMRECVYACVGT